MSSNDEFQHRRFFRGNGIVHALTNGLEFFGSALNIDPAKVENVETKRIKRITTREINSEGYLKECLEQYEKENLKINK